MAIMLALDKAIITDVPKNGWMQQTAAVPFKALHTYFSPWLTGCVAAELKFHGRWFTTCAVAVVDHSPGGILHTKKWPVSLPNSTCCGALAQLPMFPVVVAPK